MPVNTYYFDGHTSVTDNTSGQWSSTANAADSDLSTTAATSSTVNATNGLSVIGTVAPTSGGTITAVSVAVYYKFNYDGSVLNASVSLNAPSGGWTWAAINALEVQARYNSVGGTGGINGYSNGQATVLLSGTSLNASVTQNGRMQSSNNSTASTSMSFYGAVVNVTVSNSSVTGVSSITGISSITC